MKKEDYREKLAQMFISCLEEKQLNWRRGWNNTSTPLNAISKSEYQGINNFYLKLVANIRGYNDPRWATFLQINDKNNEYHPKEKWHLKKGAKGVPVEYWYPYSISEKKVLAWDTFNGMTDKDKVKYNVQLFTKYHIVFNANDIEGISEYTKPINNNVSIDEVVSKLSRNMNVEILYDGGDRAFYRPAEDKIHLPKAENFKNNYSFNATALHELAHSTGAEHRLNRSIKNIFGSSDYAFEELIAEMSSCFMAENLNISQDDLVLDNHKAYIQSWIKHIKENPDALICAIKEAQKTTNYMEYKAELIDKLEYDKNYNNIFDTQSTVPNANSVAERIFNINNSLTQSITDEKRLTKLLCDSLRQGNVSLFSMSSINMEKRNTMHVKQLHEWKKEGYDIKKGEKPIKVFTQQIKKYLVRDDKLLPMRDATPAEQELILQGKMQAVIKTSYSMGYVYDIKQTNCPKELYLSYTQNNKYDLSTEQTYETFKSSIEKGRGIEVSEQKMPVETVKSFYDNDKNKILLSSALPVSERLSALCDAYSDCLIQKTSSQLENVQEFEKSYLSLAFQRRLGIPITISSIQKTSKICTTNKLSLTDISFASARGQKALSVVMKDFENTLTHSQALTLEAAQNLAQTKNISENFLRGL
ncbi:MAG: zincin-like metallopeptidase domain-containing protein [Oscillospiraceae bacterium]